MLPPEVDLAGTTLNTNVPLICVTKWLRDLEMLKAGFSEWATSHQKWMKMFDSMQQDLDTKQQDLNTKQGLMDDLIEGSILDHISAMFLDLLAYGMINC